MSKASRLDGPRPGGTRVDPGVAYEKQVFKERLRAVARPLITWWVFLILMFGAFSIAVLIDDPDPEGIIALGIFAGITVAGVVCGQLATLLRIREWVLVLNWGLFWTFGTMFGVFATTVTGSLGVLIFAFVVLFPLFVLGGSWSLRAGRTLFGGWIPLMYGTGCAIIIAEDKGKVADWHAGSKWAVWDGFTLAVLAVGIALFLAYLVTREGHRLALWRRGPKAPLMGSVEEKGDARPRLSFFGWALLGVLAIMLTTGTAVTAPYLWRTGPGQTDDDDDPGVPGEDPGEDPGEQPQEGDKGEKKQHVNERLKKRWQEATGDGGEEAREQMSPQVSQALDLLTTLITALVLFLLAMLVFWRPIRRLLIARHFERPFRDLPPTTRVRNGWRLVEIALGDAGVEPRPNEPAASLCRRAVPTLQRMAAGTVEVHGMAEAAEIRDRVEYGLGVHPDDVALMERTARWAYHTVWDRMGEWEKIKKLYRGI
ncbi:MAG: hypothetical protein H6742_11130 [Alphaproteobacteria bacterium]|nr:hypothetical protein [Alphaproteobacteria bacterium]